MRKTPNNQQHINRTISTLVTTGLISVLILGLSSPAYSAPTKRGEIVIFQEAESTFSDADAMGAYGDANDEYVANDDAIDESKTTETETVTNTSTITASSINKKSNDRTRAVGYGDTDQEDGA